MSANRLGACLGAALLVVGCMSTPQMQPPLRSRAPLPPGSPVAGKRIVVEEFEPAPEVARYDGPTAWLAVEVAQSVARGIRERGGEAVVAAGGTSVPGDVHVRGRIVAVDGGSRAARAWAGFGAGAATVEVAGVVTARDGAVLGRFRGRRRSGTGSLGAIHLVEKCVTMVGRDVADMIASGVYREALDDPR